MVRSFLNFHISSFFRLVVVFWLPLQRPTRLLLLLLLPPTRTLLPLPRVQQLLLQLRTIAGLLLFARSLARAPIRPMATDLTILLLVANRMLLIRCQLRVLRIHISLRIHPRLRRTPAPLRLTRPPTISNLAVLLPPRVRPPRAQPIHPRCQPTLLQRPSPPSATPTSLSTVQNHRLEILRMLPSRSGAEVREEVGEGGKSVLSYRGPLLFSSFSNPSGRQKCVRNID
jgi:hypothetical protein